MAAIFHLQQHKRKSTDNEPNSVNNEKVGEETPHVSRLETLKRSPIQLMFMFITFSCNKYGSPAMQHICHVLLDWVFL